MTATPVVEIVRSIRDTVKQWDEAQKYEYHWRLKAANGEVVAHGETHTRFEDAERAWRTVQQLIVPDQPLPIFRYIPVIPVDA